ncbi:potassium transporter TrkG [Pelagicoccus sp. SDUM812003]|uniref:TrkH family potassium uptake protein n=1 Tax=Pelagicoccus sp. SDUM812003 TaxID=3041267 RepID=UPI00280F4965|nr:potassium transporter TrkG [Pelagicoccus sp. SDUM812003]MDQ8204003.1 potassium transporter TrkG [Pelagicoccus sp. SDUM812003]
MNRIKTIASLLQILVGLVSAALCFRLAGWSNDLADLPAHFSWALFLVLGSTSLEALRAVLSGDPLRYLKQRKLRLTLLALSIGASIVPGLASGSLSDRTLIAISCSSLLTLAIVSLATFTRISSSRWFSRQHPGVLGIASFGMAILFGAILLRGPNASATHQSIDWQDAFFTSTSAVCVTGLTTLDTEHDLSLFGKIVILVLIQLGGLGIMTWAYLMAVAFGERISLRDQVILQDLLTHDAISDLKQRLVTIFVITFVVELAASIVLYLQWSGIGETASEDAFHAIFHAVSGYCNAGFSSFSLNLADPRLESKSAATAIVALLVILGGLGTPVWIELIAKAKTALYNAARSRESKSERLFFSLHTRLALTTTFALLLLGALGLQLTRYAEFDGEGQSWFLSFFDSVTARTAGFNIAPLSEYSHSSLSLLMILMFIGGCPGGTAGGIKCTTFSIVLINLRQVMQSRSSTVVWKRNIPPMVTSQALAIITIGGSWIILSSVIIEWIHPEIPFFDTLFETVSALGTVGLSRGITPELSAAAKWIIIVTMFVGRLGILFVICSLLPPRPETRVTYPDESPLLS